MPSKSLVRTKVNKSTYLSEIAVSFRNVLERSRFHKVRILPFSFCYALTTLVVTWGENAGPEEEIENDEIILGKRNNGKPRTLHGSPHSLFDWKLWLSHKNKITKASFTWYVEKFESWKNFIVEPPFTAPYLILLCFAKSSALSIVASILSMVKKAAKFAV